MQTMLIFFALMVAPAACIVKSGQNLTAENSKNPIRKVVTMLQNMQEKVAAEAEAEKKLYDTFMCYCKNGKGDLEMSIAAAKAKEPEVLAGIAAAEAKVGQAQEDLKTSMISRTEAQQAIAKATQLRDKEAFAYAKEADGYKTSIGTLKDAIAALSKGMTGAFLQTFLQTRTAAVIKKLAIDGPSMTDEDRQTLMSFLSTGQASEYAPRSGEIVGILKSMMGELQKSLDDITATETAAVAAYKSLVAAKKKEIATLQAIIEKSQLAIGDLGVEIQMMKNDLSETAKALEADMKYLEGLSTDCASKEAEWPEIEKMRAQEQVAIAETIKVLNDDDALELFKKTLPSASFLQMAGTAKALKAKAIALLEQASKPTSTDAMALKFVEVALKGKIGFEKVISMIDDMVAILKQQQLDDDEHQLFCTREVDKAEENIKSAKKKLFDLEGAIDGSKETIATIKEEIEKLKDGIKALDKSVAEATEQRKAEAAEYVELLKSDSAAKEILAYAKNRLNKFYNPKMYKAPPKVEAALVQGAPVLMQVAAHQVHHAAPPPPPASFGKFSKQDSGGPIAMIDAIIADLVKEMQVAELDEKNAQKLYEQTVEEAIAKKKADTELIVEKDAAKAELESELRVLEINFKGTNKELAGAVDFQKSIHSECDFLLQYYDVRKQARASEVEALKNAKAILKGADLSLLQSAGKDAQKSQKLLRR